LAKYGGEEYLETVPKGLLNGQTEDYMEYSVTGKIIKGREPPKARSKYDEDVYLGNHTAVWGSWYSTSSGQWGFACCHSTISSSYCAGSAAIEASEAANMQDLLKQSTSNASPPASLSAGQKSFQTERERLRDQQAQAAAPAAPTAEEIDKQQNQSFSKKRLGEGDLRLDQSRLEAAIKEEKRKREGGNIADEEEWQRDKRRKYNSFAGSTDVTEEELEAYRRTRVASTEDPMANYRDEDE